MIPSKCSSPHAATPKKVLSLKTDYETNNPPPHTSMPMRKTKSFESYNEKSFLKIDCQKKLLPSPRSCPHAPVPMLPSSCLLCQCEKLNHLMGKNQYRLKADFHNNNRSRSHALIPTLPLPSPPEIKNIKN